VMCRDCGLPLRCPVDQVPLAVHLSEAQPGRFAAATGLQCHQCDHREPVPAVCPNCGSPRIKFVGLGTQRIEDEVIAQFPQARVVRWDRDAARRAGAADQLLNRFVRQQADVLVGTQMIAKGLDLPMVTLVGVVLADVGLFLPDFRASERVFGLIAQVAGRAGRSLLRGRVIVQTYNPDHPVITFAQHHDVKGFAHYELGQRNQIDLPPHVRLVRFECTHENEATARQRCNEVAALLRPRIADPAGLIGPAACYFAQRGPLFRWQVIARATSPRALLRGLVLPEDCTVDVDPMNVL
jgi:primosomal protein N' (replication factor Y) (superfamily II helicase)